MSNLFIVKDNVCFDCKNSMYIDERQEIIWEDAGYHRICETCIRKRDIRHKKDIVIAEHGFRVYKKAG